MKRWRIITKTKQSLATQRDLKAWERLGRPVPPPHCIKERTILSIAGKLGIDSFVETGTYDGMMIEAVHHAFHRIYSIELDRDLYERAKEKFADRPSITILQGDSSRVLPVVVHQLQTPALFWLDAHYSGDGTARGSTDTPILDELHTIIDHSVRNHVVLIDDARLFNGTGGYPSLKELSDVLFQSRTDLSLSVQHDIIRIHKAGGVAA